MATSVSARRSGRPNRAAGRLGLHLLLRFWAFAVFQSSEVHEMMEGNHGEGKIYLHFGFNSQHYQDI